MDAKEAIYLGLAVYRAEMRVLIRQTLYAAFGESWCSEKVAPLLPPGKQRQILRALSKGESPELLVDIGDVIAEHSELFPDAIRDGEQHARFAEIRGVRNQFAQQTRTRWHKADAESILAACGDVLRRCGLLAGAQAIEDIAQELRPESPSERP